MGKVIPNIGGGGGIASSDVTSKKSDVLKGTKTVTADSNDEVTEGALENYSGQTKGAANAYIDNDLSQIQAEVPATGKYTNTSRIAVSFGYLANLIGLAVGKLANGQKVLGLTGTYKGLGDAAAAHVLAGKRFSTASLSNAVGTMADRGAVSKTITPTTVAQLYTIEVGYHNGSGKVTVAAIPSSYQNITTSKYLFNSGSFGDISGGAAKGLYRGTDPDTKWYSGHSTDLKAPTGNLTEYGYYGLKENCMVFSEPANSRCAGAIFRRSVAFQHFKKLNIKFSFFRKSTGTETFSQLRGHWFAHFIPTTKTPGVDAISESEFTRIKYFSGEYYYTDFKAGETYSIDISGVNFEGYLAIGMYRENTGSASCFYVSQIWLSQ